MSLVVLITRHDSKGIDKRRLSEANVMARRKEVNSTLVTGGNHDRGDLSKGRRGVSSVGNEESRAFEEKE